MKRFTAVAAYLLSVGAVFAEGEIAGVFENETACYAFLAGVQKTQEVYGSFLIDVPLPPNDSEMFMKIREPLQSLVDLQRAVAAECVSGFPAAD